MRVRVCDSDGIVYNITYTYSHSHSHSHYIITLLFHTALTHTHCDTTSSSSHATSHTANYCLPLSSSGSSNATAADNNSESLYFETFYKFSHEIAINVWITLLALVIAGIYVLTRWLKLVIRRFQR